MSKDVKREIMKADVFFLKFFFSFFFFKEQSEAYHAKFYIGGII